MEIFEMQKEFDELMKSAQALIEKLKENQSKMVKRWKPNKGEEYFCVDSVGKIEKSFFTPNLNADIFRYTVGNCFKTEQEAQKELDRMVTEQELLDMCDWNNGTDLMWSILYSFSDGSFDCSWSSLTHSPYRFSSKESCEKAIEQLGTEKLKLVFRID